MVNNGNLISGKSLRWHLSRTRAICSGKLTPGIIALIMRRRLVKKKKKFTADFSDDFDNHQPGDNAGVSSRSVACLSSAMSRQKQAHSKTGGGWVGIIAERDRSAVANVSINMLRAERHNRQPTVSIRQSIDIARRSSSRQTGTNQAIAINL